MLLMPRLVPRLLLTGLIVGAALPALADPPVGLDGVIGAEWTGIAPSIITYDPLAPLNNFATPGTTNHVTGYELFSRSDSSYIYVAVRTTGPGDGAPVLFSNLGFALRYGAGPVGSAESTMTIEVTNNRAGKGGNVFPDTPADLIRFATATGASDVIEGAFHWSIFLSNALGVTGYGLPFGETAVGVRLNRSQSFGYSVAGGESYGPDRLGFFSAPEPRSLAFLGLGLLGMGRRRRR